MNYIIYNKDHNIVNTIVADEPFVTTYCEANGYTYELGIQHEPISKPESEPTELEQLRADVEFIAVMTGVEL